MRQQQERRLYVIILPSMVEFNRLPREKIAKAHFIAIKSWGGYMYVKKNRPTGQTGIVTHGWITEFLGNYS